MNSFMFYPDWLWNGYTGAWAPFYDRKNNFPTKSFASLILILDICFTIGQELIHYEDSFSFADSIINLLLNYNRFYGQQVFIDTIFLSLNLTRRKALDLI